MRPYRAFLDTVRVLVLRVRFQRDDLSTTTGDGTFLLEPTSEYSIDPPPHDRAYFEAQMQALSNYYRSVSGGKLVIVGDVFPREEKGSYVLPQRMDYYNPPEAESDQELRDRRLSELFRDAVIAADADTSIHFDRYHCVIVFHAGVGQDFAFDFDPTPNDIPSAYLDSLTLAEALGAGEAWPGISVDEGTWHVPDGIVLPEWQNQEGYEIGLLGTACLMFGHWLGLPALYDTDTGRPGIGMWGLMDQGSNNGSGLLPAQPCAWSRIFMGWCEPIVVTAGTNLPVAAWTAADSHKIYKIPINDHEYFLIENRQRDANGDGIAVGRDANGNRVEIKLGEMGDLQVLHEGTLGVITRIDEYDFGLPGSGILIWHVDERVLREKLAENRVNADPEHRAVDLEEADGAQDIGQDYGFLSPGAGAENGVPEDAFWAGNEINMLVNATDHVEFGPHTAPNSNSYAGARTGIVVTDFSDLGPVMRFSVYRLSVKEGFPVFAGAEIRGGPLVADVDGDGSDEIFAATRDIRLVCWRGDGTPYAPPAPDVPFVGVVEDTVWYPNATFFEPEAELAEEPVLAPVLGGGRVGPLVMWGCGGSVWALQATGPGSAPKVVARFDSAHLNLKPGLRSWRKPDGVVLTLRPARAGLRFDFVDSTIGGIGLLPSPIEGSVFDFVGAGKHGFFVVDSHGRLTAFDANFLERWSVSLSDGPAHLAAGDLGGDGAVEIAALSVNGVLEVWSDEGELLPGFPTEPFGPVSGSLALGDVDGRGAFEIVFATDRGLLYVVARNGVVLPGWPVELRTSASGSAKPAAATPVLVDLDGDGAADVIVPDQRGGLAAFRSDGKPLVGFPKATSDSIVAVAAGDVDGDGLLELVAAGGEGLVYAWDTDTPIDRGVWLHPHGDAYATGCATRAASPPSPPEGEGTVLVSGSLHCYPNPTSGQVAKIRFTLKRDAAVRIEIYDLSGVKVGELRVAGVGGLENEVSWDPSQVAPGIYFVRLEASNGSVTETGFTKLGVTP